MGGMVLAVGFCGKFGYSVTAIIQMSLSSIHRIDFDIDVEFLQAFLSLAEFSILFKAQAVGRVIQFILRIQ